MHIRRRVWYNQVMVPNSQSKDVPVHDGYRC